MCAASERNHHVPKFLLGRFASRAHGRTRHVWQFCKERPPVEASTKDVGVVPYFYGPATTGVEERLKRVEGEQARVLVDIEHGAPPHIYEKPLRHLLWLLAVRTNALRQQFADVATTLFDYLEDTAGSDEAMAAMTAVASQECVDLVRKEFQKLPPTYRDRALELLSDPARQRALRGRAAAQIGDLNVQGFVRQVRQLGDSLNFGKHAAGGQIRGLTRLLERADAPEGFAPTHWRLIERPSGTFVLGDSCVFAAAADGRIGSLLALGTSWRHVYLPISSGAVLVGATRAIQDLLDDEVINRASAQLSALHFYASCCTDREIGYIADIGTGVPLLSDSEVATIVRDSWKDLKARDDAAKAE